MPMYDRLCDFCGQITLDCLEPIGLPDRACPQCGHQTKRVFTQRAPAAIPDSIPGGIEIRHGICNSDGTPRRYDSKSEMARAAKERGLVNMVRHVPPNPGSDKARTTSRWVSAPVISEEERIRAWHEHERANHFPPPKATSPELGVGLVVEENFRVSEIIRDCIERSESSGYHETGVNPPASYGRIVERRAD